MVPPPRDLRVRMIELLSFYDALPPPSYRAEAVNLFDRPVAYQRSVGRALDLTPLTAGARVILIGYLEHSPLPAPLTVDGGPVESDGWTVVRWVYDL